MSLKALRKALKTAKSDEFPDGTVIRWVSSGRYTYAAIKAGEYWYTTATARNGFTSQVVSWADFLKILTRPETTSVEVASAWTAATD